MSEYPFIVKPLSHEDGGGYVVEYPDLPGCIADGASIESAIKEGSDAVAAWLETAESLGRPIPQPGLTTESQDFSGKFVQRLPKSLHAELSARAKSEGVSINSLVLSFIAKGVGFNDGFNDNIHKAN